MGKFKEENGKTRIGAFLQNCGPVAAKLLDFAGDLTGKEALNNLSSMISGSAELSTEQKAEAQALIVAEMQEITSRWESDNKSGYWLSANIRPLLLGFLTVVTSIFCFLESAESIGFTVSKDWIALFKELLKVAFIAYFGSRGLEKITKTEGVSGLLGKFKRKPK
tara:strand:- start:20 stop:514 length:495 start_codon:yes stop_codon:yes gene_type:complete